MADFVETTAEAAVGGYAGIKKVRGLLVSLEKVEGKVPEGADWEPKDQIEGKLEDALILEMFPNADDMELKDGKFTFWVPYAAEGKTPTSGSLYMRCFCASSEEVGKKRVGENKGEYVTLERQDRLLFTMKEKNKETEEMEKIEVRSVNRAGMPSSGSWCFVSDETADSGSVKDYIRDECIVGKNEKAALRALLTDPRAKQFPEFKQALQAGEIGDLLDVELVDGKFALARTPEGE